MARKLRAFVFSHLGSRTDLVKQFGLPTARKSKKKTKEDTPAGTTGTEVHQALAPQAIPAGPSRNPTAP